MSILETIARGVQPQQGPFDAYASGAKSRYMLDEIGRQEQKRSALESLAPLAASGDRKALGQLSAVDPEAARNIAGTLKSLGDADREGVKQFYDLAGRALVAADTPEKFDAVMTNLSSVIPQAKGYVGQFGQRDSLINMARSVKETLDSGVAFSGGGISAIPGAVEAGAAKIGAETAAKEANSYQSFAPGHVVIPPQAGGSIPGAGRFSGSPPAQTPTRQAPAVPEVFQGLVSENADRTGLSPQLVGAVLMRESGGNPNAVSSKGAQGLMQVMPGTSRDPGFGVQPARDASPEENIRVGTDYLAALKNKYGGDERLALAAYNWGPGNLDSWLASGADPRKVPGETQKYVYGLTGGFVTSPQGNTPQRVQVADASGGLPAGAFVVPKPQEPTSDQREYQQAVAEGFKGSFMDYQKDLKKAGATNVTVNGDNSLQKGLGEAVSKRIEASLGTANAAVGQLSSTQEAKRLLDSGIISGAGANWKLSLDKALSSVGVGGEKVANTEAFVAAMGRQTMDLVKNLGAGAGISNADRDFAAQVAGGNIELNEASIRKIIDINERAARAAITRHNATIQPILDDPNTPASVKASLTVAEPEASVPAAYEATKSVGGKNYVKVGGQWYERS